jgi:S-adenosylhomocysteine hydrolase
LDDVVDVLLEKGVDTVLPGFNAKSDQIAAQVLSGKAAKPSDLVGARLRDYFEKHTFVDVKDLNLDAPPQHLLPTDGEAAILSALADSADKNGWLTQADAERALGPAGRAVFEKLSHLLHGGDLDVPSTRPISKFRLIPSEDADKLSLSARRKSFIERMPVMKEITRQLGGPDALKGISMTSVQHLFPTSIALYDELEANGVQRRQMGIEGKPYSASPDVVHRLHAEGFHIHDWNDFIFGAEMNGESLFAKEIPKWALAELFLGVDPQHDTAYLTPEQMREKVKELVPQWEKAGKRFLLLDDGGHLVEALHKFFPEAAHLCVAVEQTMSGANRLKGLKLECPVVDMAESPLKKTVENRLIGESVTNDTLREVDEAGLKIQPKEATILGYGAVGKGTAEALRRRGYTVHVYDISPEAMAQAKADGFDTGTRDDMLQHGQLLIGCTGKTSLTPDEYSKLPKGAVLANAGSGDYELGMDTKLPGDPNATVDPTGEGFSTLNGQKVRTGEAVTKQIGFLHRVVHGSDGADRLVLRSGYVVNMTHDVPPEYAQLIRGMLLASCLQAAKETQPGLRPLSQQAQDLIEGVTKKSLDAAGLSIEAPDFTQAKSWDW